VQVRRICSTTKEEGKGELTKIENQNKNLQKEANSGAAGDIEDCQY
jgi:hypothetical protein